MDITMPQLGETVTEGTVTRWLKQVGDQVAPDELIFEVSTDKVDSEVPAAGGGYLVEILVPEGRDGPGRHPPGRAGRRPARRATAVAAAPSPPRRTRRPRPSRPRPRSRAGPGRGARRRGTEAEPEPVEAVETVEAARAEAPEAPAAGRPAAPKRRACRTPAPEPPWPRPSREKAVPTGAAAAGPESGNGHGSPGCCCRRSCAG